MKPAGVGDCGLLVQAVEFVVEVELVLWAHSVTVSGDDLGVVLDGSDDISQSVEFSEVLFWRFLDICVFLILISLFGLTLLPLLPLFCGRWWLFSTITLNINQNLVLIPAKHLIIEIRTQGIMLYQQIWKLLKLKIINPLLNKQLRVEKPLMRELIRLVKPERHKNVIRVGNTFNLAPELDFIFIGVVTEDGCTGHFEAQSLIDGESTFIRR